MFRCLPAATLHRFESLPFRAEVVMAPPESNSGDIDYTHYASKMKEYIRRVNSFNLSEQPDQSNNLRSAQ